MSHALLKRMNLGSSLWAVSRGLARSRDRYRDVLQDADEPRRGELDGRGNLSLEGLRRFCRFFLDVCVDQVVYMDSVLSPTELLRRIEIWASEETAASRLPAVPSRFCAKPFSLAR